MFAAMEANEQKRTQNLLAREQKRHQTHHKEVMGKKSNFEETKQKLEKAIQESREAAQRREEEARVRAAEARAKHEQLEQQRKGQHDQRTDRIKQKHIELAFSIAVSISIAHSSSWIIGMYPRLPSM